jgi:serine-protein kinase ATM
LEIVSTFFDPAIALILQASKNGATQVSDASVYRQYAVFAERQYQAILQTPDVIRWRLYADRKRQEIKNRGEKIHKTQRGSREWHEMSKEQKKAMALLAEDQAAFERHNGAREVFLRQAILMFSRCLEASDHYDDDSALRLCSLWFANFDVATMQTTVREALDRTPSRKFVFLAHQLAARMSKPDTETLPESQELLQTLLTRMCKEHPFHSLYQVYCLRPGQASPEPSSSNRRHSSRLEPTDSQAHRATAAHQIFDRLRNDEVTGSRVRDVETLCNASLQWAKLPIKGNKLYDKKHNKSPFNVPSSAAILALRNLRVPVITAHTPVDPSLKYSHCVWVSHYDPTFQTAGGVNLPKISVCYGVDGQQYRQLVCQVMMTEDFTNWSNSVQRRGR